MMPEIMDLYPKILLILQTILFGLVILLLYQGVSIYLYIRRNRQMLAGIKGPENPHLIAGTFASFPKDAHERATYFIDMCNKYGKDQGFVLLWGFLGRPVISCCSPKMLGQICKSSEPKAQGRNGIYRFMKPWLGEGLLTANGSKWARNRRLLTPAFHFEILKPYINVFNRSGDTLVDKLREKAESGERFETFQNVCLCTLEIILKCAFSYDKDVQNLGESNPYVKTINRITDALVMRALTPLHYFDFVWNRSKPGIQFNKDCDYVHSIAEEIIARRKESLSKQGATIQTRYVDFLDILLAAKDEEGKGLSGIEIRNEVDTFLFEGHDTTASAISWILYSLAEHPEYQKKCQQEIDDILDQSGSEELGWADLSKVEYLTMCIKEGMRLHSPVPIVTRETTKEFDLGEGRTAPIGSMVQLNIWGTNHLEATWGPDHMEFKPERFSRDNAAKMEPFQYIPFSAGSRNCIGQNFAMNEEKIVLSKLLRNFTFRLDPNHEIRRSMSAVMRTSTGMYMYVDKRKH
ncbi:hypothetical protein ACF0H5_007910 [Mactra antiquata]